MVETQIVKWSDRKPQPWKNGGGITFELAAGPGGADSSSFDWRISVAEVASDGPFSIFDGIDRTLVLLEGTGAELIVDNQPRVLSEAHSKLAFDGAANTSARLVAGPIRDLNIMSRRGRVAHRVTAQAGGRLVPTGNHWLIFALDDDIAVTVDATNARLSRYDLLQVRGEPASAMVDGRIWLIDLVHADEAQSIHLDNYV